jgi:hypothetical protein
MPREEVRRDRRMGTTAMNITFVGAIVICGALLLALALIRALRNDNPPDPEPNKPS